MSILFEPLKLGNVEIKNRFVNAAAYECMAAENGKVSDAFVKRYAKLAEGEVGLSITGHIYVHPLGRAAQHQAGIYSDDMIPGLKRTVEAVHEHGGKIVFQLSHAGRQSTKKLIGQTPLCPSSHGRDPLYFVKPKAMSEEQIHQVIEAFAKAAGRAAEAGADGVQIHAAHTYLVNQFLSPFFNHRDDEWGSSDKNRFRFLKHVVLETRKALPDSMALLVKLNANDHVPRDGVTPPLAAKYAGWLAELGIDGLTLSCGSPYYATWNMCRGDVPVDDLANVLDWWMRPAAKLIMRRWVGKYDLEEGYNLESAKVVRPATGQLALGAVGGMRRVSHMEEVVERGLVDFIAMCRPFIREPYLVRRIKAGKTDAATCISCNKCLTSAGNNVPLRCFA
jgi:2,4-dienoyl-CoA reductase-like NADH-dependent reductase (Old Yellow Enzyme family)